LINKQTIFWIVAALIPVILLVLLEATLRIAGVDEDRSEPFIKLEDAGGHQAFNPAYPTRYFTTFAPAVSFDPFASRKSNDIIRIVALGGSSAAGFPYSFYNSFPTQVRRRLQHHVFGRRVELVNLAMTAVNSYALWDLADKVVALDPDAVLIYAGHNEFYGAFGVGSTQYGIGQSVWPKRLLLALKNSVVFRLLEQLIAGRPDPGQTVDPDGRTLMARVVAESGIELNGDIYKAGLRQFEANMGDVLNTFREASIPVYIGTLVSNLGDQAPLGEDVEAIRAFDQAGKVLAQGDTAEALRFYRQASDRDDIRFRAPSAINEIIRKLAAEKGAVLVDAEAAFIARSQTGIPGDDLFDDHLHPNHAGYLLLADTFFEAMRSSPLLPEPVFEMDMTQYPPLDPIDRAYAALQIARLRGGYPFVKEISFEEEKARFESTISDFRKRSPYDSLAVLISTRALAHVEGVRKGIQLARATSDTAAGLAMSFGLIYWQPLNHDLVDNLTGYAAENQNFDELTRLLAMEAYSFSGRTLPVNLLSAVTLRMRYLKDARILLDMVERRDPDNRSMLFNKARLLVLEGDTLGARRYFDRYSR
jgi:lysophospholipase L1-like esterase